MNTEIFETLYELLAEDKQILAEAFDIAGDIHFEEIEAEYRRLGEALALRWADVDFRSEKLAIERQAGGADGTDGATGGFVGAAIGVLLFLVLLVPTLRRGDD